MQLASRLLASNVASPCVSTTYTIAHPEFFCDTIRYGGCAATSRGTPSDFHKQLMLYVSVQVKLLLILPPPAAFLHETPSPPSTTHFLNFFISSEKFMFFPRFVWRQWYSIHVGIPVVGFNVPLDVCKLVGCYFDAYFICIS